MWVLMDKKTIEEETLDMLEGSRNYNRWIYNSIKSCLGKNILEAGCGIGKMTEFLLENEREVLGIDINKSHIARIKEKFAKNKKFRAMLFDISGENILIKGEFDTVVCLNVLHHIPNEENALRNMNKLLNKNGKLILLEPALPWIYGTLDINENCLRRYTKKGVKKLLAKNGFRVEKCRYMNLIGAFGWFIRGKILKKKRLNAGQAQLFDRLVPVIAKIEKIIPVQLGLSLVCICRKD
jgi:2-polyprenyl-3-methyl-5-hydroxy-6-metoxy-1,4-benzoquinol methylase